MLNPEAKYKKKIAVMQGKIDELQGLSTELVELQYITNRDLRGITKGTLRQINQVDRVLKLMKKRLL